MFSLTFVKTRSIVVAEVSVTLVVRQLTDQFGIVNRESQLLSMGI